MKIAVLIGGTSAERDVSLASGIAIARAAKANGHTVLAIDCAYGDRLVDFEHLDAASLVKTTPPDIEKQKTVLDRNLFQTVDFLIQNKVEVVFNGLHGGYGENGQLSALLDIANLAYTGSGTVASAVGMDKHLSKINFQASQVSTPPWIHVRRGEPISDMLLEDLGLPLIIKPNAQGSTVGLTLIHSLAELDTAIQVAYEFDSRVLLEQYVPGREITVAILGQEALPIVEIIPKSGFYDYQSKYQSGMTQYEVPASIPADLTEAIQSAALRAHRGLQCRGYSRVDFRLRDDGQFFCLELNTLPGMTATSLVPKAAKAAGMTFEELVEQIIQLALKP